MEKYYEKWKEQLFPVRTVTLPEDFFEMAGVKVNVADVDLFHSYELEYENGDMHASAIDESIYFFCDSGFIESDPSDEEIIRYLQRHVV